MQLQRKAAEREKKRQQKQERKQQQKQKHWQQKANKTKEEKKYAVIHAICTGSLGAGFDDRNDTGIQQMFFLPRLGLAVLRVSARLGLVSLALLPNSPK